MPKKKIVKSKKGKGKRKKSLLREWVEAIIFAGIAALILRTFVIQTFKIPTGSMENTFLPGDFLIANKFIFRFREPQRQEVIIFKYPGDPARPQPTKKYSKIFGPIYWNNENFFFKYYTRRDFIKRVIGMPGDTVKVVNKKVFINGKPLEEKYAHHFDPRVIPYKYGNRYINGKFVGSRDNFGPVVVPKDCYFVMGDNRDNSSDSRFWGFLHKKYLQGIPIIIYWSGWPKWLHRVRWDRIFKIV